MFKKFYFIFSLNYFFNQNISANIEIKARTAILQDFLSGEIFMKKKQIDQFIQHQ